MFGNAYPSCSSLLHYTKEISKNTKENFETYRVTKKKRKNSPFITRTVVANKLCKGITNSFFLLKTEIQMQISNTEPFLYIFRVRRYLTIKMGL